MKKKTVLLPIILMITCQIIGQNIKDIDGNIYSTITIGTQTWTVENLKTTRFTNGRIIPYVYEDTVWGSLTTSAFCTYDNDVTYREKFGNLYNFYAVIDTNGLCPVGWHVPTNEEWEILIEFLGGDSIAGGKLREAGITHWHQSNPWADNSSGLTVLPAGYRFSDYGFYKGQFNGLYGNGAIWTSTSSSDSTSLSKYFYRGDASLGHIDHKNSYGRSVRCIKNNSAENNEYQNNGNIIFFPNPSNGRFTIHLEDESLDFDFDVLIYNSNGQLIRKLKNECFIDLSNEPKQVYSILLKTKNKTYNGKIIIQ